MTIENISEKADPAPGGSYSHGVVAHGFLYTCGMGPIDPATGKVVEGGVAEQTRQTLKNLQGFEGGARQAIGDASRR
jgi:2-iminobutanoate/2-iminopropanoate deaminase